MSRFALAFVALLVTVVFATHGVDVSQQCLPSGWSCLKNNGFTFGIVRCHCSNGQRDSNCPHTIYNAWQGGMAHVDAYIFPCPTCSASGYDQVKDTVNYLKEYNCNYGMLWFDVEGTQYWKKTQQENRAFINSMLQAVKEMGVHLGVYTSKSQWDPIVGNWDGLKSYPLWYAHYDGHDNFNDFVSFGGWTKPSIKQYLGDKSMCGCGVDLDFY